MEKDYRRTKTTVSLINYHFVFCPRCRRKIFDIPGVEDRFKQLVIEKCEALGIEILAMECHRDHVHLFLNCSPKQSPSFVVSQIKGCTRAYHQAGIFTSFQNTQLVDAVIFCKHCRRCQFRHYTPVCRDTEDQIMRQSRVYTHAAN